MDDAHADREQRERPRGGAELKAEQEVSSEPFVRTPSPERVATVDREPQRQRDEQGRGERYEGEADDLPRAPEPAEAPQQAHAEEHGEADHEVADRAVETARDEGPDREQRRVVLRIVEEVRSRRSREHGGHPREQRDEKQRLSPRRDVVLVLLAEREEHRARAQQGRRHAQPPGARRTELVGDGRLGGHVGNVATGRSD